MNDKERARYDATIRQLSMARTLERVLLTLIFIVSIGLSMIVFWQNQTFQADSKRRSDDRQKQIETLSDNQAELKAYMKCIALQASSNELGDSAKLDKCAVSMTPRELGE